MVPLGRRVIVEILTISLILTLPHFWQNGCSLAPALFTPYGTSFSERRAMFGTHTLPLRE
jgi:hypothetical protein